MKIYLVLGSGVAHVFLFVTRIIVNVVTGGHDGLGTHVAGSADSRVLEHAGLVLLQGIGYAKVYQFQGRRHKYKVGWLQVRVDDAWDRSWTMLRC